MNIISKGRHFNAFPAPRNRRTGEMAAGGEAEYPLSCHTRNESRRAPIRRMFLNIHFLKSRPWKANPITIRTAFHSGSLIDLSFIASETKQSMTIWIAVPRLTMTVNHIPLAIPGKKTCSTFSVYISQAMETRK
jgi:hypothetical protein